MTLLDLLIHLLDVRKVCSYTDNDYVISSHIG